LGSICYIDTAPLGLLLPIGSLRVRFVAHARFGKTPQEFIARTPLVHPEAMEDPGLLVRLAS